MASLTMEWNFAMMRKNTVQTRHYCSLLFIFGGHATKHFLLGDRVRKSARGKISEF